MSLGPPDHFTHLGQRLLCLDAELRGTVLWQSDQQWGWSGTVRAVQVQKTTATMVFQSSALPGLGSPMPTEQGELLPALALLTTSRIQAFVNLHLLSRYSHIISRKRPCSTLGLWEDSCHSALSPTLVLCPSKHGTFCRLLRDLHI